MNAARLSLVAAAWPLALGRTLARITKLAKSAKLANSANVTLVPTVVWTAVLVVMSGGAQRVLADEKPTGRNSDAAKPAAAKPDTENPATDQAAAAKSAARNGAADASAAKESLEKVPLESVLVVFESSGKLVAMRVVKEHQIAVLQACFPDYYARPKSDAVVKWAPKYEIYFNFQDGRTIRVLVSGNSRYWTTGAGELEMRGMYFSGVIHELLKANMKSGDE